MERTDARVTAWLSSWDAVQNLNNLVNGKNSLGQGDSLRILNRSARTLCDLSRADESVGIAAGAELERRRVENKRLKEFYDQALKEKFSG